MPKSAAKSASKKPNAAPPPVTRDQAKVQLLTTMVALKDEILKKQSPDGRRLLSLEVRAERFLMGEEHRIAKQWPSSIMLASTIGPATPARRGCGR